MATAQPPSLHLGDYLEKLQGTTFRKLYQQPSTAFAIFRRMLPHLGRLTSATREQSKRKLTFSQTAKTLVMRMLYMPDPMKLTDLDTWVKPEAKG